MRRAGRITAIVLASVGALAAVIWFGGRMWLGRSVARQDGTIRIHGLSAPVEITFDARGVPQVWAKTSRDARFALGWLHASDRLFQMEIIRRLARGELAEVFGEAALESDVEQRRIGFSRRAARDLTALTPAARDALQAYVDGVNAWMSTTPVLPPELVLLRLRPRPWTIEDCLTVLSYQTWFSHELMDFDDPYRELIARFGEPARRVLSEAHPWSPPTVKAGLAELTGSSGMRVTAASNSWAVAPSRSASGAALHAADPHLSINQAPGLWYLAGLHAEDGLDVVGVTYAGGPSVVMGHNASISYAFTVASVDLIDTYDEELSEDGSVRTPSGWVPLKTIEESIQVKGEAKPRKFTFLETPTGVITERKGTRAVSLRWSGFDFSTAGIVDASLDLQRATDFDTFRRAVTRFGALDANWVYADRAGNVGYQLGAPIPVRDFDTFARHPAADARFAWKGYRKLEETPYALNPANGWVASCNGRVVPPDWPYPIPGFYDPYRAPRIEELLDGQPMLDRKAMRAFQLDWESGIARRWKGLAADGAAQAGFAVEAEALRTWDAKMQSTIPTPTLFAIWWREMSHEMFEDDLGKDWEKGHHLRDMALTEGLTQVIDDRRTPREETAVDISARAIRRAIPIAAGRNWSNASRLMIRHPLSRVAILDQWLSLSRGPFPAPGDPGSINANFNSFDETTGQFRSRIGASMRFVMDWSDPDAFSIAVAMGQSGNPLSPHYDDFLAPSRRGDVWTVPFTREMVFAGKASLLRLEPR